VTVVPCESIGSEIRVGFTGGRREVTDAQWSWLEATLRAIGLTSRVLDVSSVVLYHGCCVGKDEAAHVIARSLGWRTCGYPSNLTNLISDLACDERFEPREPLERNRVIVSMIDLLVAVPDSIEIEAPRSGSWYTVRYAERVGRSVLIYPAVASPRFSSFVFTSSTDPR